MSVLDELADSKVERLGALARRVQETGFPGLESLSVYLDRGVVRRAEHSDNHNALGADLAKYQRVLPGDLVFNRLRTWQGGFGASRHEGIVSPAYVVLRPDNAHARYLDYLLHSAPYLAELTRLSKWMPPSQFDILWVDLKSLPVPAIGVDEQIRTAAFLDHRVARIDQIIAARRRQIGLVRERFIELREQRFATLSDRVRASRVMSILPGFAFASDDYSYDASDVRLLRGINVSVGTLRWDDVVYWPVHLTAAMSLYRLTAGDLVMGMDRPWIGAGLRIARIRPEDDGVLLLQRVAKLIPGEGLDSSFLFHALQEHAFRAGVEGDLTGLSIPHLSGEQILGHRLPIASRPEQRAIAKALDADHAASEIQAARLSTSIDLLAEYKTSLITAAVTGGLDVTTAASGIPA